jgi:hypothetical protein
VQIEAKSLLRHCHDCLRSTTLKKIGVNRYVKTVFAIVFCLPVLYVLSSGPVAVYQISEVQLGEQDRFSMVLEEAYTPIWNLADNDSFVAKPLQAYLDFCARVWSRYQTVPDL